MIDEHDNAILIDFGASKQYDEESGENTSTLLGKTPGYAPIEQMGNSVQNFTPATDIYSLGATLYKMLTGITPPEANLLVSDDESLQPLPPTISPETRKAVEQAMKVRRKDRPQSVEEFLGILSNKEEIIPTPIIEEPIQNETDNEATICEALDTENVAKIDDDKKHFGTIINNIGVLSFAIFIMVGISTAFDYELVLDFWFHTMELTEVNGFFVDFSVWLTGSIIILIFHLFKYRNQKRRYNVILPLCLMPIGFYCGQFSFTIAYSEPELEALLFLIADSMMTISIISILNNNKCGLCLFSISFFYMIYIDFIHSFPENIYGWMCILPEILSTIGVILILSERNGKQYRWSIMKWKLSEKEILFNIAYFSCVIVAILYYYLKSLVSNKNWTS